MIVLIRIGGLLTFMAGLVGAAWNATSPDSRSADFAPYATIAVAWACGVATVRGIIDMTRTDR